MKKAAWLALYLIGIQAEAQVNNFWQVLAEVGFRNQNKDGYGVDVPEFSKNLKSWNNKKIQLKGYVIPMGEVGGTGKFMFSSLPFNVCYFCGAAGPETVVQVESIEAIPFSSQSIVLQGILVLNDKDPDNHMYLLKSAKKL